MAEMETIEFVAFGLVLAAVAYYCWERAAKRKAREQQLDEMEERLRRLEATEYNRGQGPEST
jgi:hypothetical protein